MNQFPFLIFFTPLLIVPMFVLVSFIISRIGWVKLANNYKYEEDFIGDRVGIISASINGANYNNCLILKTNESGFYLKPMLIFRAFHAPIFIPWSEIKDTRAEKMFLSDLVVLNIGTPLVATIKLNQRSYEKLERSRVR